MNNYSTLKADIRNSLTQELEGVKHSIRKKKEIKYKGLTADSVNKVIKNSFKEISNLRFEVEYKELIALSNSMSNKETKYFLCFNPIIDNTN